MLDFRTALSHVLSCEARTAAPSGASLERHAHSLADHEHASLDRSAQGISSMQPGPCAFRIAGRPFTTGADLQNSSSKPEDALAGDQETPRSAVEMAQMLANGVSVSAEGEVLEPHKHGRPRAAEAQPPPAAVTELEQTVADPGAEQGEDYWEDFVSLVQQRKRTATPGMPSLHAAMQLLQSSRFGAVSQSTKAENSNISPHLVL